MLLYCLCLRCNMYTPYDVVIWRGEAREQALVTYCYGCKLSHTEFAFNLPKNQKELDELQRLRADKNNSKKCKRYSIHCGF